MSQVAPVQSEGSAVTAVYGPPTQLTPLVCPLAGADKVPLLGVAAKAHNVMETRQSATKTVRIAFSSRDRQAESTRIPRVVLRLRWDSTSLLPTDRKSTRLNSSHQIISYAVFCLKKKTKAP